MPLPAFGTVFSGFEFLGIILVTAIPFGIYDLVEAMDNVESAEAAGDAYPTTRVLTADGVVSLIGCLMGNPFINAVYIGHPGWKAMGGRIGYSAATGVMVIVLSWFGIIAVMSSLIPVVAISPILLYIGMLIGAQAFQETPKHHAPAIVLALMPHLAAWGKTADRRRARRGRHQRRGGRHRQARPGRRALSRARGARRRRDPRPAWCSARSAAFIIDKKFAEAAAFAAAGAVLTFFGFMHGEAVGFAVTPSVACAYAMVAAFLFALEPDAGGGAGATMLDPKAVPAE